MEKIVSLDSYRNKQQEDKEKRLNNLQDRSRKSIKLTEDKTELGEENWIAKEVNSNPVRFLKMIRRKNRFIFNLQELVYRVSYEKAEEAMKKEKPEAKITICLKEYLRFVAIVDGIGELFIKDEKETN